MRRASRRALALTAMALPILLPEAYAEAGDGLDTYLGDPGTTLPNLVPDIRTVAVTQETTIDPLNGGVVPIGPRQLSFDTWVQNVGRASLQLTASDIQDAAGRSVSQCVSWRTDRVCRAQQPVGGFGLDPEHNHFHFQEFATYELRQVLRNGRVDYSRRGLVASADKVSFCLMDSTRTRNDAFPVQFYAGCGGVVQGISAGWADIYGIGVPGQAFPVDGLQDGRYALVVRLDYANRLLETDDVDNAVEVTIELSKGATQASIIGRHQPS